MTTKKLFISQPMNDLSNEEIEIKRAEIIQKVKDQGFDNVEVIDSFFKDAPHDAKPLWFLGKSFELLSTADIVYFGGDWKNARGCLMEHEAAIKYLVAEGAVIIEE